MLVGDTASVPLVAFVPVQPPPALHEVALAEDQAMVETLPEAISGGLADSATVGVGFGAGLPDDEVAKSKSMLATTGG